MTDFDIWDIVKVAFPYTNRPVQQHRPALVVGRHDAAGSPVFLWVLMITSASHRRWQGDIEVSDLSVTGLPALSIVRCAKIATIEAQAAARIGYLPERDRFEIRHQMSGTLAQVLAAPRLTS